MLLLALADVPAGPEEAPPQELSPSAIATTIAVAPVARRRGLRARCVIAGEQRIVPAKSCQHGQASTVHACHRSLHAFFREALRAYPSRAVCSHSCAWVIVCGQPVTPTGVLCLISRPLEARSSGAIVLP